MGTVCPHCGAASPGTSLWCPFCHAPLIAGSGGQGRASTTRENRATVERGVEVAEAAPSTEPQWRLELGRKLDAYRVRNGQSLPKPPQSRLPFPEMKPGEARRAAASAVPKPANPPANVQPATPRGPERLAIFVHQPELDFSAGSTASPNHGLVPVAGLSRRMLAWFVDVGFLLTCWALFIGLVAALGVPIGSSRVALSIWLAILFLLYAQYFGIFTAFVGTTPGMRYAGLRVVSFDGNPPTPRQLLWRTFGYLVAGGAGMLGFLWALWDDDKLCWQDRTSQTYLTALVPVPEQHTAEARR